jgi:FixJ family two-component response regulator
MPDMSGIELQALLLAHERRMPFIFITAFPDKTVRTKVLKAGAICLLTKPFDKQTLLKYLDIALKGQGTSE